MNLDYRYEYKVSKKNQYKSWKSLSKEERDKKLIVNINNLIVSLNSRVENIEEYLPLLNINKSYVAWFLKGYEDMIDSIISSLVGLDYLCNKIAGYGGEDGTIWVPSV